MNNVTLTSKCKALHFDVSQTDGKPIPELEAQELLSTVEGYEDFVQALMNVMMFIPTTTTTQI